MNDIPRSDVWTLRFNNESRELAIEVLRPNRPLDTFLELLVALIEQEVRPDVLFEVVRSHSKLSNLGGPFDYCLDVRGAFQPTFGTWRVLESRFGRGGTQADAPYAFLYEIAARVDAFHLEEAYQQCKEDPGIIAFSHRGLGWSTWQHSVSDDLGLTIKTNFGYGKSSYFTITVTYRGMDLIPFSEWVLYRYARLYEIVHCSASYPVSMDSWPKAFEYFAEVNNLAVSDEKAFVKRYVIDECSKLVNGLQDILSGTEFKVFEFERIYTDFEPLGYELIKYRSEKISGALDLVEYIKRYESIADIGHFIREIEKLAQRAAFMIEEELDQLQQDIINALETYYPAQRQAGVLERWVMAFQSAKDARVDSFDALDGSESSIHELEQERAEKAEEWIDQTYGLRLSELKAEENTLRGVVNVTGNTLGDYYRTRRLLNGYRKKIASYFEII